VCSSDLKSTAARQLAAAEGLVHLNTGAIYRAVAHLTDEGGIDAERQPARAAEIARAMDFRQENTAGQARFLVAPRAGTPRKDLTEALFSAALTQKLKPVVNNAAVRAAVVDHARRAARELIAKGAPGVVLEGRDTGTVIFPHADVKFYLQASLEVRTQRRADELRARGENFDAQGLRDQIAYRDQIDESRSVGPLKPAADAIHVDTTRLGPEEVLAFLREKLAPHR
jgi:cytidylate kinase